MAALDRERPLMMFVASPGRCGTQFLTQLVSAAGADAEHEAPPTMANATLIAALKGSGCEMSRTCKRAALLERANRLLASESLARLVDAVASDAVSTATERLADGRAAALAPRRRRVYFDGNHLFAPAFATLASDVAHERGVDVGLVVLRRNLGALVSSRCELGHLGPRRCGWARTSPPGSARRWARGRGSLGETPCRKSSSRKPSERRESERAS